VAAELDAKKGRKKKNAGIGREKKKEGDGAEILGGDLNGEKRVKQVEGGTNNTKVNKENKARRVTRKGESTPKLTAWDK